MKRINLVLLALLLGCQSAPKSIRALRAVYETESIELAKLQDPFGGLPKEQFGYVLWDPQTKKVLESQGEEKSFIPASTSKIPTVLAALEILGADYRFKTQLFHTGKIENGTLKGDLYLKGGGDPFLKISHLFQLSQALAAKGITKVEGNFYYDESDFIPSEEIEEEREPWAPYNTGLSALSVEFNQLRVRWMPDDEKRSVLIYSVPSFEFERFEIADRSSGGESAFEYRKDSNGDDVWRLLSAPANGGSERVPMKKPALMTAGWFLKLCGIQQVVLKTPLPGSVPASTTLLGSYESPPLVDLAESLMEYSNNTAAELIQMAAARKIAGKPVSRDEASQAINRWLKLKVPGLNEFPFLMKNGSGLTSASRVSPRSLLEVLQYAYEKGPAWMAGRSFQSLLPMNGWKGSLRDRLDSPGVAFRVWAKSGTLFYGDALAGYLHARSGKTLLFVVMATDWESRLKLEQDVGQSSAQIPDEEVKKAKAWTSKVKQAEDQVVQRWIYQY